MTGLSLNPLNYTSPPSTSSSSSSTSTSANTNPKKCAWVVFLLSTPSYLPGILVLAWTLRKINSRYPLIVAVNPKLTQLDDGTILKALREYDLEVRIIEPIVPRGEVTLIAERFVDTWSKAAVFGFEDYDRVCLIDGDMMIRRNMDELFNIPLKDDQIAATFACVCNLDRSAWAPSDWTRDNCGFTPSHGSQAISHPGPAQPNGTHSFLNSGLVVLTPSTALLQRIHRLVESPSGEDQARIKEWAFPDQDLFADLFRGKWISIPWIYNAIKTMRYWHGNFYNDEEVRNLHYICKKPWTYRPTPNPPDLAKTTGKVYKVESGDYYAQVRDGEVGLDEKRADAVTHGWWWEEYEEMLDDMRQRGYGWIEMVEDLTDRRTM
ncbi:uncharacterized protein I303_103826 [Kwoniella dejecticola CBS 10117]|uniref:Galactinol synthase n=1 Tax=Kwoniella dejecticola CBS 10117 TaxID=1296121 RepID=A0A1A6A7U1_9TREE|nr:uncharacterized protein I303_03845 [Kwoniella dejecticola CBS 10117]OBR86125.1 hypothetical protein I303_03845 [Kwoniella dejecticola CBS 10117]